MKKLLIISILFPLLVFAQNPSRNYVKKKVYTKPTTTSAITANDTLVSVQYYNGLSKPIQSIAVKAGGNMQDVVTPIVYDNTGKQSKSYLPYALAGQSTPSLNYRPNDIIIGNIEGYYYTKFHETSINNPNPYSETFYEDSPLGRVRKQAAPGSAWMGNQDNDNDHTIKFSYDSNNINEVPNFTVTFATLNTEQPKLGIDGYYEPWTLIKNITKDENWTEADGNNKTTHEFKNLQGKLLLKRTFNDGIAHDTYYVYDKYNNLTYVIPPLAADGIISGDMPQVYAGRHYLWTDAALVDAVLADEYAREFRDYDNSQILNLDLSDKYGGQGGFSIIPDNNGSIILNLNMSFSNPMRLKNGAILSLDEFGRFDDKELGRIQGLDYDYIFRIQDNKLVITGGGAITAVNTSLSGDYRLEHNINYPWIAVCDIDTDAATKYKNDIEGLDNSQILSVYTPNQYGALGGVSVSIDNNNALTFSLNITSSDSLSLKKGAAFPLNISRRLKNRPLGKVMGQGYEYNLSLRDNYLYIDGYGKFTSISFSGVFNELQPQLEINEEVIEGLCYIYHYDYKNRVVEKKIPGKGWEHLVYDKLNRLVMAQDQNLAAESKWLFTKYDKFNRPVYSGQVTDTRNRLQLQAYYYDYALPLNERRLVTGETPLSHSGINISYTFSIYPQSTPTNNFTIFSVNYYDDYNYSDFTQTVIPSEVYSVPVTQNVKMMPTGSFVKVLGTNDWVYSFAAYDNEGRAIFSYTDDRHLKYRTNVRIKLNFVGAPVNTKTNHSKQYTTGSGGTTATYWESISISDDYVYDHMGRLLYHEQFETTKPHKELIVYNKYDELGQLVEKKVGGTRGSSYATTKGLQTVNLNFNIRGWLTGINNVDDNLSAGNDLFAFGINYNTATLTGTQALYNGNIAETHWKSKTDNKLRSYSYSYDDINRLKDANYHGAYALNTNPAAIENYFEGNIQYDKNGNILHLERYGYRNNNSIDKIDELSYIYEPYSNRLQQVHDHAFEEGFKNGSNTGNDYEYDANGNMKHDANKQIESITYNHLNLPTKVSFTSTKYITYVYDASGQKLKKTVFDNGNTTITEYNGGFVYEKTGSGGNRLQFFGTEEGYATRDINNDLSYVYQYKDHLGNVRLSYSNAIQAQEDIVLSQGAGGFDAKGGATAQVQSNGLVVNATGAYQGVRKTIAATAAPGDYFEIQLNVDRGTTDVVRVFISESTGGGQWTPYFVGYLAPGQQTLTFTHTVSQQCQLNLTLDKPDTSTLLSTTTNFRISYFMARKKGIEVIAENNYYAFGLQHKGYNNIINGGNALAQQYKYNGIEHEDAFGFDMYEMGARQYDPAIARWVVIDPVIHYDFSPYNAFDNNPVFWADPSGANSVGWRDVFGEAFDNAGSGITTYTNNGDGTFSQTGYKSDEELLEMGRQQNADLSNGGGGGVEGFSSEIEAVVAFAMQYNLQDNEVSTFLYSYINPNTGLKNWGFYDPVIGTQGSVSDADIRGAYGDFSLLEAKLKSEGKSIEADVHTHAKARFTKGVLSPSDFFWSEQDIKYLMNDLKQADGTPTQNIYNRPIRGFLVTPAGQFFYFNPSTNYNDPKNRRYGNDVTDLNGKKIDKGVPMYLWPKNYPAIPRDTRIRNNWIYHPPLGEYH